MTEINQNIEATSQHELVVNNGVSIQNDNTGLAQTNTTANGLAGDTVSMSMSAIQSEVMPPRERSISVFQKYENRVPKKQKNIIANLASSLMILLLWITFISPSVLLSWALADYFLYGIDPLVSTLLLKE